MHLLTASAITFHRNGDRVFAPQDIELATGQCLLVTGPNGAGKTTLLRLMAGILRPAEGSVQRADCTFVGHLPALKGDLNCHENLAFTARMAGEVCADIDSALARVGLNHLGAKPAHALSAGQKKRLSLARLLVSPAPLWLLDEPYASLDHDGAAMVDSLMNQHLAAAGSVILSTHLRRPEIASVPSEVIL